MLIEMASFGAKVMHSRAVSLSAKFNFPFYIYSSFEKGDGTMVGDFLEFPKLKSITQMDVVLIKMGYDDEILKKLTSNDIQIILFQKLSNEIILVIKQSDFNQFRNLFENFESYHNKKFVSVIGYGLANSTEIHSKIIKYPIEFLTISDLRISFLIDSNLFESVLDDLISNLN